MRSPTRSAALLSALSWGALPAAGLLAAGGAGAAAGALGGLLVCGCRLPALLRRQRMTRGADRLDDLGLLGLERPLVIGAAIALAALALIAS